jgi:cell division protein FtsN
MARDYARNRSSRRNARIAELTPRGGRRPSGQRRLNAYRQPRRPRTLLWLATGILLGFLLAGGLYLKTCNTNPVTKNLANAATVKTNPENKNKSKVKSAEKRSENSETTNISESEDPEISELASARLKSKLNKIVKKNDDDEEPQYEFYTMLSKNTVETPKSNNPETPSQKATENQIENPSEKPISKTQNKNTTNNHYQLQVASFSKLQDADRLKAELILQGHNASIQKQQINNVVHYRVYIGAFNSSKEAHAKQQNLSKNKIKSIVVPG